MANERYFKYYFRWLGITFSLIAATVAAVAFVSYSVTKNFIAKQMEITQQAVLSNIEGDYARIAEEIYLHLDTVGPRERALQTLLGELGTVRLTFTAKKTGIANLPERKVVEGDRPTFHKQSDGDFITPIYFDDLYIGDLRTEIHFKLSTGFHQLPFGITLFMIIGVLSAAAISLFLLKAAVFAPLSQLLAEEAEATTMGKVARQVAHDIRSPLTALNVVVAQSGKMPEEVRILARAAVQRISDIANDLLQRSRHGDQSPNTSHVLDLQKNTVLRPELLSSVLETLASEKRLQFRNRIDLEISLNYDDAYSAFVAINLIEFQRSISNLINNAAEAISGSGFVRMRLSEVGDRVLLNIEDNGCGIDDESLKSIGKAGATFGKQDGNGLGLAHARSTIESLDGTLEIKSTKDQGTNISIDLKKSEIPDWFTRCISISDDTNLIVIDDDLSIHEVWRSRLREMRARGFNGQLIHFSNPTALTAGLIDLDVSSSYFLVDFEFLDSIHNGVDLIQSNGLIGRSCMVTSKFDETLPREACKRIGIGMIPKFLASTVPIEFIAKPSFRQKPDLA